MQIILGGTGAVGSETARQLHDLGHQVLVAGRDASELDQAAAKGYLTAKFDAMEPGSVENLILRVSEEHGPPAGIIHAVGSILLKPAHLTSPEQFESILRVNLFSAFEVIRAAAKVQRKQGGSVVLFSSAAARISIANHEAIAAAKGGIESLTRSAAATYARSGIRINAIAPGLVKSKLSRPIWESAGSASASEAMHALNRLGEPRDVASMAAWLASPDNSWVTGQIFGVDGGLGTLITRPRA